MQSLRLAIGAHSGRSTRRVMISRSSVVSFVPHIISECFRGRELEESDQETLILAEWLNMGLQHLEAEYLFGPLRLSMTYSSRHDRTGIIST